MDFTKLLRKDRGIGDNHRMELVNRGGQSFFVPASDHENISISNFSKWEQAFRIFSNVYLKHNPNRATELIQYNHIIHTAATTYIWDTVYSHDKEFRVHMGRFPQRSWGIILQQAWTMLLKDHHRLGDGPPAKFAKGGSKKEICRRFNKGLCLAGLKCNFDHRCLECGKFGHRAHICRKRLAKANSPSTTDVQVTTNPVQVTSPQGNSASNHHKK